MSRLPFRVSRHLPTVRRLAGPTPLRFSAPFNGTSRASSVVRGLSKPTSDPLSGFLNLSAVSARTCFGALFHAPTVPGCPPSEPSPRPDRELLSKPTHFPAVLHRGVKAHRSCLIALRFSRRPRSHAVAQFLARLWAPFPWPKPVPGPPGHRTAFAAPFLRFVDSEALLPGRIRSLATGCPTARPLLS